MIQGGNKPADLKDWTVLSEPIIGHARQVLGLLHLARNRHSEPSTREWTALLQGVRIAGLAIENRRNYSDLLYRSSFDPLTGINNRSSADTKLDAVIETASQTPNIFGLIYIDLDAFKQVNDKYGHKLGDQYLQEASRRLARQLRDVDMLARVGGDEFIAIVPCVHTRSEVEEIALRLQRCFDHPFELGTHQLQGSASMGIALFPTDGNSKDALLSAADAAMYVNKNMHKQRASRV